MSAARGLCAGFKLNSKEKQIGRHRTTHLSDVCSLLCPAQGGGVEGEVFEVWHVRGSERRGRFVLVPQ